MSLVVREKKWRFIKSLEIRYFDYPCLICQKNQYHNKFLYNRSILTILPILLVRQVAQLGMVDRDLGVFLSHRLRML